jgi:hypothetical protein
MEFGFRNERRRRTLGNARSEKEKTTQIVSACGGVDFTLEDPPMSLNQPSRRHWLATFFGGLFGWFCGSHAAAVQNQERATRSILPPRPDTAALVD